jgi:hypothetical protein
LLFIIFTYRSRFDLYLLSFLHPFLLSFLPKFIHFFVVTKGVNSCSSEKCHLD